MRITGLASGMDIDKMVKDLMKAKRTSYNTMVQKRLSIEYQRETYREISSKIIDFRNNKLSSYNLTDSINAKKSEVSGNTNAISINSTTSAAAGALTVNVDQLASQANSLYTFSANETRNLGELGFQEGTDPTQVVIKINDKEISLLKTASLSDLAAAINTQSSTVKATAVYNESSGQFSIAATQTGIGKLKIEGATLSNLAYSYSPNESRNLGQLGFQEGSDPSKVVIKVNGKEISLLKTASLSDLAAAINADASTGASASFDTASGKLVIASTTTGVNKQPVITGISQSATSVGVNQGQNAKVSINGVSYEQESNRFNVNGFDFNAKAVSGGNGTTTITASTDTNKIIDTIKSFVNDYNSLIENIHAKLSEEKYRTFLPLTDEQREEMDESQIKKWEEKAKSGLIKNDDILTKLVSDMRIATTSLVGGYDTGEVREDGSKIFQSIGISTGLYSEKGKLVLKESDLRNALEADPDKLIAMFSKRGTDVSPTSEESGVFAKISASAMLSLQSLATKAGTSLTSTSLSGTLLESSLLGSRVRDMKQNESNMLARLNRYETQYYKQFSAMETAINKFNSQSSSLAGFSS